uniref:Uncharacterized protein n=1 Tax=Rhizophora mucronata TaxID=61149 RepID=A0A2P2NSE1_RHIMU
MKLCALYTKDNLINQSKDGV